jgi:hypothetical protein
MLSQPNATGEEQMTIGDPPMFAARAAHNVAAPANVKHHEHGLYAEGEHDVLSNAAAAAPRLLKCFDAPVSICCTHQRA